MGQEEGEGGGKDQQRWGAEEELRVSKWDRWWREGKEGGKDGRAAADLFKNQGPELATVNFSSYS